VAAAAALDRAIALSPSHAHYLSERGYLYHQAKDWQHSLETYKAAEEAVKLISDKQGQIAERTRALRGQGYALVELGDTRRWRTEEVPARSLGRSTRTTRCLARSSTTSRDCAPSETDRGSANHAFASHNGNAFVTSVSRSRKRLEDFGRRWHRDGRSRGFWAC